MDTKDMSNGEMMAVILKHDVYNEKGRLKHLVNDEIMEKYIQDLEDPDFITEFDEDDAGYDTDDEGPEPSVAPF